MQSKPPITPADQPTSINREAFTALSPAEKYEYVKALILALPDDSPVLDFIVLVLDMAKKNREASAPPDGTPQTAL